MTTLTEPQLLGCIFASVVGGFGAGWWMCKRVGLGEVERKLHKRNLIEQARREERRRMLTQYDPFTKQKYKPRDSGDGVQLDKPNPLRRSSTGRVMVSNSPVQQANSGIDPVTGMLLMDQVFKNDHQPSSDSVGGHTMHEAPAPSSQPDTPCSPSHDSGSSYDSGSSSSDCGSSDSGGGGGGGD